MELFYILIFTTLYGKKVNRTLQIYLDQPDIHDFPKIPSREILMGMQPDSESLVYLHADRCPPLMALLHGTQPWHHNRVPPPRVGVELSKLPAPSLTPVWPQSDPRLLWHPWSKVWLGQQDVDSWFARGARPESSRSKPRVFQEHFSWNS